MCGVSAFGIRLSIFGQKSGSADPRFWGPRLVDVRTEKPRTPKPGVRATKVEFIRALAPLPVVCFSMTFSLCSGDFDVSPPRCSSGLSVS